MRELAKLRTELDMAFDLQRATEDAVLAQRRRAKELDDIQAEGRANLASLPAHLRG